MITHKELAAGKWEQYTFLFQMANIASEIERTILWKKKNKTFLTQQALHRALETDESWKKYFRFFSYAAAIERGR